MDTIDGVMQKKIRKEDSLETSQEYSQGTFLGSGNVDEKEVMKDHKKALNDDKNNDDNKNSNSETENNSNNNCQMNKLHLYCVNTSNLEGHDNSNRKKQNENDDENHHEDVGIRIVQNNQNENLKDEKKKEHINVKDKSSSSEHSDVIEINNIGSRVGSVPSITETKEIFNTKIIVKNENESDKNNKNAKDEKQCEKETVTVTVTDGDMIPSPSILVFPYYTVSMQMTRQGPNSVLGPGVSAFRSTVSHTSNDFKLLWTSSSVCTASARTLSFSCHLMTLFFYDYFC